MKNTKTILILLLLTGCVDAYPSEDIETCATVIYHKSPGEVEGKQRQIDKLMRENALLKRQVQELRLDCRSVRTQ